MAVQQELGCHPEVIRFVCRSQKHYYKLLSRVPTARIREGSSYALVNSLTEYLELKDFFSEYDHIEYEFEIQKISTARCVSNLHLKELNFLRARYEYGGDIFISWSSRKRVHISGVKDRLREKLVQLKWLVHYEKVDRSFTPDTYRILSTAGIFGDFQKQFGDKLNIVHIEENNEVILTGGKNEITEASAFLTKKTNELKRLRVNDFLLDWKKLTFLRKCLQGTSFAERDVIETFQRTLGVVALRPDGEDVIITSITEHSLLKTIMHFTTMISIVELSSSINPEIFRLEVWKETRTRTLEKFAVLPIDEDDEITLVGLRQSILQCSDELEDLGQEVIVTLTPSVLKLFRGYGEQFIHNFSTVTVNIAIKDSGEVVLRGKKSAFEPAKEIFLAKLGQVVTREYYLKTSFVGFLKSNEGQQVMENFEQNHECSIFIPKESTVEAPLTLEKYDPNMLCHCTVETAAGSEVSIQLYSRRNITEHKCGVLIHLFCQTTDFHNGISGSILGSAGRKILYDLQLHRKLGGFKPLHTTAGNLLSCKHIVHCCLPSTKDGPAFRDDLIFTILNILRAADDTDEEVVAVPVVLEEKNRSLRSIGKSIVKALEDAIPMSLKRVDIVGIASSPAELAKQFSSEILDRVSATKLPTEEEEGRKAIILKYDEKKMIPYHGMFDVISPEKWVSDVEKKLWKANIRGNKAVEITVPPHGNPSYTARLTKRTLKDFNQIHPNTFQLTMLENDSATTQAYESVFCGTQRLYEDRRTVMIELVKLSVKVGNITDETVDAIVNFRYQGSPSQEDSLSKRIQREAAHVTTLHRENFITVTTAGRLRCKKIMQAVVPQKFYGFDPDALQNAVCDTALEIIKTANRQHLSTISISPNVEGILFLNVVRVSMEIRRSIEMFVQSGEEIFTHAVNIVLADGNLKNRVLSVVIDHPFRKVMAGRVEMNRVLEDFKTVFLPIVLLISEAIKFLLNLFSEQNPKSSYCKKILVSAFSRDGAGGALDLLELEIKSHEKSEIVRDGRVPDFDKWHRRRRERLQKTYNVDVVTSPQKNELAIFGFGMNPSYAKREIEVLLEGCLRPGTEIVAWQRLSGEDRFSFGKQACQALERAFERREPVAHIEDYVSDGDYEVKYNIKLSDMFGDGKEDEPTLQRVANTNIDPDLPDEWEQMGKTPLGIPISSKGDEFKKIEDILSQRGARFRIIHIERIQNLSLYIQYKAKKEEVAHKHSFRSNVEIERVLFHGTSEESTESILKHGFNRSYSGKNATLFGHGTYFAVDPKVAHKYAAEGKDGSRKLFMANVLTGMFTKGSEKLRVLPKIKGTLDHYDSLVDDEADPKKFVVFHDAAAYPSYLIKYKVK